MKLIILLRTLSTYSQLSVVMNVRTSYYDDITYQTAKNNEVDTGNVEIYVVDFEYGYKHFILNPRI